MQIISNSQYHAALSKIETLIEKGFKKLNKSETEELKQISIDVEKYENEKYPKEIRNKK